MNRKQRRAAAKDGASGRPEERSTLIAQAMALHRRSAFDQVIPVYRKLIALTPRDSSLHFNLGLALRAVGRSGEAIAAYDQAIALNPGDPEARNNRGNALRDCGRVAEAAAAYRQAVALDPRWPPATHNLADTLLEAGRPGEAACAYRRVLALRPDHAEPAYRLGLLERRLGRPGPAAAALKAALALQPDLADGQRMLGVLFTERGRPDLARPCYAACARLDPEDRLGARLLLAGLGGAALPEQASTAHLLRVYKDRAGREDQVGRLSTYYAPGIVAERLARLADGRKLDILDAGCGSGLAGALIGVHARRLDGVDLSPEMLRYARAKRIYRQLCCEDLVAFLDRHRQAYDVVVSVGTLIHFGDLSRVFTAAAAALRDEGLFLFTLLTDQGIVDSRHYRLAPSFDYASGGCYEHGQGYVRELAGSTGQWTIEMLDRIEHEADQAGRGKAGLVVALRRTLR